MDKKTKAKIRKNNMKLYPIYSMFGLDFMFYYVIELLFFIQVKGLTAANVVLLDSFFAAFAIIVQFVTVIIVNKIGKKKSIILGNTLNLIAVLMNVFGNSFAIFVVSKAISAVGFGLKSITEATFLNSTIPETKRAGDIFTKIDGKSYARYSYFKATSTLIAGFLFDINPYIPMGLCVACLVITILVAMNFREIEDDEEVKDGKVENNSFQNVKQGATFILKSKRLKALLLMIAMIWAVLCVHSTYNTALLKEIGISASMIGIIGAVMELIKGMYSTKANEFNKRFSNHLLTIVALTVTLTIIFSGIVTLLPIDYRIQAMVIIVLDTIVYVMKGVQQVIKKRYMANFVKPDTLLQVYSFNTISKNLLRMFMSYIASLILNFMNIKYASVFIGVLFTSIVLLISLYMKSRVGLEPEKYDEKDVEVIK